MPPFDYADSSVAIREDLPTAFRAAWQRLARPGSWWTGTERVAIAAALRSTRGCRLCDERKSALSPEAVQGEHDHDGDLSESAVEAVHRVVRDPARLSRAWYEKVSVQLGDAAYVELLGLVVAVLSIDSFHRGMGLPLEPLPTPEPGEPRRERPASAMPGEAWVPMINRPEGAESDLWSGRGPNVIRALSLVPDAVRQLKELSRAMYLEMHQVADPSAQRGALLRAQMELVAGRVSALNECFY